MKIKTTFLASMLAIAGVSTLAAIPWDAKYNPTGSQPRGTAAVQNPCCNIKTRLAGNQDGKGYLSRQEVTCKNNCKAAHTGKNCTPVDARKCAK